MEIYKNLILKFSFLKRARQTFKVSSSLRGRRKKGRERGKPTPATPARFQGVLFHSTCGGGGGGGGGRSGVIFVSGAFWRTSINDIHRASSCVFAFSLRF